MGCISTHHFHSNSLPDPNGYKIAHLAAPEKMWEITVPINVGFFFFNPSSYLTIRKVVVPKSGFPSDLSALLRSPSGTRKGLAEYSNEPSQGEEEEEEEEEEEDLRCRLRRSGATRHPYTIAYLSGTMYSHTYDLILFNEQ